MKYALFILRQIFEYLAFGIFLIVFFNVLFLFDLIQRIGYLFGRIGIETTEYWFNAAILLCLRITGAKITFTRLDTIPPDGPYVIISNHQSMFDISTIFVGLSEISPRFVSKIELGKWIPGISTCLRHSQAALIDRSNPSQAISEINRFSKYIKEIKGSAVIFPEGTRGLDGQIKKFKLKGSTTLINQCLPCWVIPVAIDGSWKLQSRKRGPIPLGIEVEAFSLKPIFVANNENLEDILKNVEMAISTKINDLRKTKKEDQK